MRKPPLPILSTLALLLANADTSLAFDFTVIDVPGGNGEHARAVNNSGQIVGGFQPDGVERTDIWVRQPNGTIDTFTLPTERHAQVYGISDLGQVVGTSVVAHNPGTEKVVVPWVYNINRNYYREYHYAPPGNQLSPDAAITEVTNDGQTIVGYYDTTVDQSEYSGFVDSIVGDNIDGEDFRTIDGPADLGQTFIWGTNARGMLVGRDFRSAFVSRDGVQFDLFQVDGNFSTAFDINNAGLVVGSYHSPDLSQELGFIRTDNGLLRGISAPNAVATTIWGINDSRTFVGSFEDANGESFAYFSTVPEPTSCVLLGIALIGFIWTRRLHCCHFDNSRYARSPFQWGGRAYV